MWTLTQRRLTPERMDDPAVDQDELAQGLKYLQFVNRRLGGASAVLRHLRRWSRGWPPDQTVRILDVGTGSADIPLAIAEWARQSRKRVHITGVDLHPVTVKLAREHSAGRDEIEIIQADARQLTELFNPESFEYVLASLFLHHLPDIEVLTVLRMMDRLATRGMIWNDLVRVRFPRLMLWPAIFWAPDMVKHDAIVSVQAGFTRREAIDLAQRAGWARLRFRRHLAHRFTLVSEKGEPQ